MQKHSLQALARELSAKAAAAKGGRAADGRQAFLIAALIAARPRTWCPHAIQCFHCFRSCVLIELAG